MLFYFTNIRPHGRNMRGAFFAELEVTDMPISINRESPGQKNRSDFQTERPSLDRNTTEIKTSKSSPLSGMANHVLPWLLQVLDGISLGYRAIGRMAERVQLMIGRLLHSLSGQVTTVVLPA